MIKERYDYNIGGADYSSYRRTDPCIAKYIYDALGSSKTVLNVGAGSGSYEPEERYVTAVEPSEVMRAQRLPNRPPAVKGTAEALPFDDNSFDASMAIITIHHWKDLKKGLREMRRVTTGQVVILTFDPYADHEFWLYDYAPEIKEIDKMRYPKIQDITDILGGSSEVQKIPVTLDCVDGIQEAFYGRPEHLLDPALRKAQSTWSCLSPGVEDRVVNALAHDLKTGLWDDRYGAFRKKPEISSALRLIINKPA